MVQPLHETPFKDFPEGEDADSMIKRIAAHLNALHAKLIFRLDVEKTVQINSCHVVWLTHARNNHIVADSDGLTVLAHSVETPSEYQRLCSLSYEDIGAFFCSVNIQNVRTFLAATNFTPRQLYNELLRFERLFYKFDIRHNL